MKQDPKFSLTISSVYILLVLGFPQVLRKRGWALQNLMGVGGGGRGAKFNTWGKHGVEKYL